MGYDLWIKLSYSKSNWLMQVNQNKSIAIGTELLKVHKLENKTFSSQYCVYTIINNWTTLLGVLVQWNGHYV